MAVAGSHGTPFGGLCVAHDILDLVEGILDEGLDVVAVEMVAVEHIAGEDSHDGLAANILGPLQELEQSETVGGTVAPGTLVAGTEVRVADGLLPVEAVGEVVALEVVASGEAQELGIHVGHHLHEVGAQAVLAILEAGGKEGDTCELDAAGLVGDDEKAGILRVGLAVGGGELIVDLLPTASEAAHLGLGIGGGAVGTLQGDGERAHGLGGIVVVACCWLTDIERSFESGALTDGESPVALADDA